MPVNAAAQRWPGGYIAVDWGTTNRRAWRIGPDGAAQDAIADGMGVVAVPTGGFPQAVAELRARLGDLPMLLGGMVGSDRGWRKTPYVRCPAAAADLARALMWVEPGRSAIVPGLSQRERDADVMRGEEVQVFGAVALGQAPADGLLCHPGTHAKWISLRARAITGFTSMMTGEMFQLLRDHSMLAPLLRKEPQDGSAFRAGVEAALEGRPLLAGLFGVRARHLMGIGPADTAAYASGLLIGADVAGGLASRPEPGPVTLIGRLDLCTLYGVALHMAGRQSQTVDGEQAFLAGIALVADHILGQPESARHVRT